MLITSSHNYLLSLRLVKFPPSPKSPIRFSYLYSTASLAEEEVEHDPKNSIDVFKEWGCTDDHISQILRRRPSLRNADLPILQSTLNLLSGLGLTSFDLVKIVNCRPRYLNCRINNCFDERLQFLHNLFGSRDMLVKAVVRNPSLLTYDFHCKLKPVIGFYGELGIRGNDLVSMLLTRPTLIPRTSLNEEKLNYIHRTGISKDSRMYKYVVTLFAISHLETIHEKMANLERFGHSQDQVLGLIGRSPLLLTLSIDKVQRNMTLVLGLLKLSADVILKYPFLLFSNLETVLRPRFALIGKMRVMGLVPQISGTSMFTLLRMKESRFLKAYVKCHGNDIANELMEFYTNAKGVKRLAGALKKNYCKGFPF
ncbi:Transcription termination factor, mitochondrial/chloroplastic [Dillenia turbinata]|uniref:Transcription termination factor, mitochondrial/chloroplastic n=1 Tax=Dillenia turbinata TaxID=194707 RepID=A0AAN8YVS5_9MAGN